jgi:hypothetical protein
VKAIQPIKETARTIEGRLNFVQRFLRKKYGPEILFVFLVGSGVASSWYSNERGRDLGKADSALVFQSEIKSLRKDSARLEKDLLKSEGEITELSLKLDTCNSGNSIEKINQKVLDAIEETERMKKSMQEKFMYDDKFNKNIDNILKTKKS